MMACANGCSSQPPPANLPLPQQPSAPADDAEKVVREALSNAFGVAGKSIAMDRPICDPPLSADPIDMLDIIFRLERKVGIEIKREEMQKAVGVDFVTGPLKITPNQLVTFVKDLRKNRRTKQ